MVPAAAGLCAGFFARAEDDGMLKESDPEALAVGYHVDAAKVDRAKFPLYGAGQTCASCDLYTGEAGEPTGGCSLFYGRGVTAKGWCNAWAAKKKA
jgi:hypothetical protein